MRITITGRNIELTEGLKAAVEEKLSKLEKFFAPDTNVFVTLSVEKERQKIEVTIPIKGHVIRSSKKMNVADNFNEAFIDSDADEDEEIKIVRTKRFGMKPMYPEDACVQMELTGHDFFVFRNAENDEVNVVYKIHWMPFFCVKCIIYTVILCVKSIRESRLYIKYVIRYDYI